MDARRAEEGRLEPPPVPSRAWNPPRSVGLEPRGRPPRGVIIINLGDNMMIRTQISLDEKAYREAKAEARRQGISRPSSFVALSGSARPPAIEAAPWMRYAGAVASGDPEASQTVDAVVYGRPRP